MWKLIAHRLSHHTASDSSSNNANARIHHKSLKSSQNSLKRTLFAWAFLFCRPKPNTMFYWFDLMIDTPDRYTWLILLHLLLLKTRTSVKNSWEEEEAKQGEKEAQRKASGLKCALVSTHTHTHFLSKWVRLLTSLYPRENTIRQWQYTRYEQNTTHQRAQTSAASAWASYA